MAGKAILNQQPANRLTRTKGQGRRLLLRAFPVGLLAGLVAVAFQVMLAVAEEGRRIGLAYAHSLGEWGWLVAMGGCALCVGTGVWLVQSLAPDAAGSGIPQLKVVLHHRRSMQALRLLGVKFLGGLLAIGGGLALGREGPTVQMGGALGQQLSQITDTHPEDRRIITSAGAGAGLAAAFNAPLAGMLFVIEELHGFVSPPLLFAVFIAAVTADVVTRTVFGQLSVFHVPMPSIPPLTVLPWAALLGVLAGLLGVLFNRTLLATHRLMARLRRWPLGASGLLVGALVGLVGLWLPEAVGSGVPLTEQVLAAEIGWRPALQYLVLRFALTMVSYGSGAAGGIFSPLLLFGALLGASAAALLQPWLPLAIPEQQQLGAAIVGMGACFTAIVRTPLTGIVIVLEMTDGFHLLLPLMVACLIAYTVAGALGDTPVYEALLKQQLAAKARDSTRSL
jgi:CIC family chloride channel protein